LKLKELSEVAGGLGDISVGLGVKRFAQWLMKVPALARVLGCVQGTLRENEMQNADSGEKQKGFQQHFLSRKSLRCPAVAISPTKDYSDLRLVRLATPPATLKPKK
jgi:hypothetical protein